MKVPGMKGAGSEPGIVIKLGKQQMREHDQIEQLRRKRTMEIVTRYTRPGSISCALSRESRCRQRVMPAQRRQQTEWKTWKSASADIGVPEEQQAAGRMVKDNGIRAASTALRPHRARRAWRSLRDSLAKAGTRQQAAFERETTDTV